MRKHNRSGIDWSVPGAAKKHRKTYHRKDRPIYVRSDRGAGNGSHLTIEQQEALMADVSRMSLTEAARRHGVTRVTAVAYRKRAKRNG